MAAALMNYENALKGLGKGRFNLLLGNGFSVNCDPIFQYQKLYEIAKEKGLSARAQRVFDKLGTSNFEGVMRLLDAADWVARTYELITPDDRSILNDVEVIKQTLVQSVAAAHLPNTGAIPDESKSIALEFLKPYYNIFTTNYDLLPYWVNLSNKDRPIWQDGFASSENEPDAPYVVFSHALRDNRGLFYLHGALHLYLSDGELRKHCWNRTGQPLTELIRQGLTDAAYPLFIAEGESDKKTEQIQRSGYLWYCYSKLSRIESPLLVFGHSLGGSDSHVGDAIRHSKCPYLVVGLHGDLSAAHNQEIVTSVEQLQTAREKMVKEGNSNVSLSIDFFDSSTAKVWR